MKNFKIRALFAGNDKSESTTKEPLSMSSASIVSSAPPITKPLMTPRPHRRKSTPRCKIPQSPRHTSHSSMSSPREGSHFVNESAFAPKVEEVTASSEALDLSDRTGAGYSYTLDRDGGRGYSNGLVAGTMPGFVFEEEAMKAEYGDSEYAAVEPKNFKNEWMEEKIDLSTNPVVQNEIEQADVKVKTEFKVDDSALPSISTVDQLSDAVAAFTQQPFQIQKPAIQRSANRRKPRKAPIKVEKKSMLSPFPSPDANEQVAVVVNNNTVPNNAPDLFDKSVLQTSKKPGNSLLTISAGGKVQRGRRPDIGDMKSAFEEIGNMAKCLICNKILANKNNRTFHWRSHVGDKRYTCDICHKAFTHPSNMRSHRKIHTDEKPFPCDLCDRRFRRRDYLLQHLERFHYNPKTPGLTDQAPDNSGSVQGSESNSN